MNELTITQCEYLKAIIELTQRHGMAPSLREIAKEMNIASTNAVAEIIGRLVRHGFVKQRKGVARGLIVTPAGWEWKGRFL